MTKILEDLAQRCAGDGKFSTTNWGMYIDGAI